MNWITNVVRPGIKALLSRKETPENLWIKCPESGQLVFHKDVESNLWVIPGSGYHMRMGAEQRLKHMFDNGEFDEIAFRDVVADPLKFRDEKKYADRLRDEFAALMHCDRALAHRTGQYECHQKQSDRVHRQTDRADVRTTGCLLPDS